MRVVVQRVVEASVTVDGELTGKIGHGLLIFAGFEDADSETDLEWMAGKLIRTRIFSDAQGSMNLNLQEAGGEILLVSQFTLFASVKKGNRPSWSRAARGEISRPLYDRFAHLLEATLKRPIAKGVFGADMRVSLINDGPVTLSIDSRAPAS